MKRVAMILALLVCGSLSAAREHSHSNVVYEERYRPYPYYGRYDKRVMEGDRHWAYDRETFGRDHDEHWRDRDHDRYAHDHD